MRIFLASSLVVTMAFSPLVDYAATPAGPAAIQQPDNSQNPQYTPQDNSQQQNAPQDQQQQQQYPQQQDNSQNQGNPQTGDQGSSGYQNFSPDQLDNLLSPIALYPDPLLAQVLVAATFPDQVGQAAQYVRGNGTNGVDDQNWDVSVRAVAHYPTVIEMMSDKIDWTTSLGQAYVNQSTDVSTSVQRLRQQAKNVGNLQTNAQQEVLTNDNYIAINPVQPQYIYVPVYDPAIVYYRRPYYGPAIYFGTGFAIGAWLNLGFRWGYGGGFGGIYYTGWNPYGWGHGCWNCGWIGRSRVYVNYHSNVYINNRYTNININRTVVNRTVNVNNINRYNYVHKNVNYNNVTRNNEHIANRTANNYRPGNNSRPGQNGGGEQRPGNNVRPGENGGGVQRPTNNVRPGENGGGVQRPTTGNTNYNRPANYNRTLDSNINNQRANDFRGHDNNNNNRPNNQQQRPQENRSYQQAPHAFGTGEGNFNARQSQQRGQESRQQAQRPQQHEQRAPQQRSAPQNRGGGGNHGGGGRKP